ncbi:hypothetical protein FKM82_024346 [Ascaphus truei]
MVLRLSLFVKTIGGLSGKNFVKMGSKCKMYQYLLRICFILLCDLLNLVMKYGVLLSLSGLYFSLCFFIFGLTICGAVLDVMASLSIVSSTKCMGVSWVPMSLTFIW